MGKFYYFKCVFWPFLFSFPSALLMIENFEAFFCYFSQNHPTSSQYNFEFQFKTTSCATNAKERIFSTQKHKNPKSIRKFKKKKTIRNRIKNSRRWITKLLRPQRAKTKSSLDKDLIDSWPDITCLTNLYMRDCLMKPTLYFMLQCISSQST